MRTLRWCVAILLLIVGAGLLVPGLYVAMWTDWLPQRELRPSEVQRIVMARDYVELQRTRTGRIPQPAEFQEWANSAPTELRLEGAGFAYLAIDEASYFFEWWGGNASMRWRSRSPVDVGEIRESEYFIFGKKLNDLSVFFCFAAAAIYLAQVALPRRRASSAS